MPRHPGDMNRTHTHTHTHTSHPCDDGEEGEGDGCARCVEVQVWILIAAVVCVAPFIGKLREARKPDDRQTRAHDRVGEAGVGAGTCAVRNLLVEQQRQQDEENRDDERGETDANAGIHRRHVARAEDGPIERRAVLS